MSLKKKNVYLDNWNDVKKITKEKAAKEAAEKANHDVTKTYVGEQLDDYEEKDIVRESGDIARLEKMIEDISTGGGADLSAYLKKDEAAETYATKSEIPSLDDYAKKSDLPDVSEFVTQADVNETVATEVAKVVADAPEDFDTLKEVADYIASDKTRAAQIETAISDLSTNKADKSELADYAKKSELPVVPTAVSAFTNDAGYLTEHQDISGKADKAELGNYALKTDLNAYATTEYVNNEIARVEEEIPDVSAFVTEQQMTQAIAAAQPDLSGLATKTELAEVEEKIPSIEGLVDEATLAAAVDDKATISQVAAVDEKADSLESALAETNDAVDAKANTVDVSTAFENVDTELEAKADANDVVSKAEYDELKAKFDYLEQLVMEYAAGAEQEKINDGKIDDLSPDNKAVNITEPMQSVKLPEATVAYTVDVPLKENATVELTSNKYAYINNTSEEPVSVAFGREVPETEADTVANPFIYITGQYDTLTVSNVKISQKDYDVNTISNIVITEDNEKTVEITAALADGATITNNSDCPVSINNKAVTPQDGEPNSVIIVAPNSTVTITGGQYNEFTSTVGDNTLFINKAAHIKKLIVTKGNVIVNDYTIDGHIDEIVNDTEYTVTPKTVEVYAQSDWTKASSTPAIYEVQNDITTTSRIAPGIFGSNARIKLNGYKVTCSDANGAFLLRGTSHFIIENGTIDCTQAYGVWLSGDGIVELKDVTIDADTHALYIEKPNGRIITTGNCYFRVKGDDKRYVANYYDATYTGGWTTGFHFGAGTKFEDFDPMNSMGEPGGPVNLLDSGFHTVKTTEVIDGVEHDIYTVVADE